MKILNNFKGKVGINYDFKHLIKRLRGILISDVRSIVLNKVPINKSHVRNHLNGHKNLEQLLNPQD